jgi:hypothetical protein
MKIITRNEVIDTAALGSVRLQNSNVRVNAAGKNIMTTEYRIELRDMTMKPVGYIDFRTGADKAEKVFEQIRQAMELGGQGTVRADEQMTIRIADPKDRTFEIQEGHTEVKQE